MPSPAVTLANEYFAANPAQRIGIKNRASTSLNALQAKTFEEEMKRGGTEINDYDVKCFSNVSSKTGADLMAMLNVLITDLDIEKFTYRYWFNYFWTEGQKAFFENANLVQSTAMLKLFVKRAGTSVPTKMDFSEGTDNEILALVRRYYVLNTAISEAQQREFLTYLLKLGFRAGPQMSVTTGTDSSIKGLADKFYQYSRRTEGHADKQKIFWRGEARSPEQVMLQATTRLSDVPSLADSMNMARPWNPFSDHLTNSYMWYRNGSNTDNDYFTAVSVALNFETGCCFPKINEKRVYDFPDANPASWTPTLIEKHRNSLGQVLSTTTRSTMIVTKTTLYLSAPSGPTVFTQAVQGKEAFPEFAVGGISHEEIFGYLVVYRAFSGVDEKSKFTVFIDKPASSRVRFNKKTQKMEKVPSALHNKTQFLPEVWKSLCAEYDRCLQLPTFETAWSGAGATPMVLKPGTYLTGAPPLSAAAFLALTRKQTPTVKPQHV